jgi:hypothetical protein
MSEKILGLNNLALRLPSVLFSLGVIILTYLLTLRISGKKIVALFGAFFVSISPWLFVFSRTGYEATAGLMFFLLGIYLFLCADKRYLLILLSTTSFILSIYSYNSFRIIVPIALIFLSIYFLKISKNYSGRLILAIIFALVLFGLSLVPIVRLNILDAGGARLQQVGIISHTGSRIEIVKIFGQNYLSHFNPQFLFISGDRNLRSQQSGFGELYLMDLPLLALGLFYILKSKKFLNWLPLLMVLIAPIPASLTFESPHALRSISAVPFFSVISAFGVLTLSQILKSSRFIFLAILTFYIFAFGNYYLNFLNNYSKNSTADWQYGYQQIFTNFSTDQYDKLIISDSYAQPYIFGLYYQKYSPENFRSEVAYNSVDKWGFSAVHSFGKYIFQPVTMDKLPSGKLLIFASPNEKLENRKYDGIIKNLDGTIAFYIYKYEN